MAERIERAPVAYPIRFAIAGDSGGWPDPTADAIFRRARASARDARAAALFFANLGDFAGPGTIERHEHQAFDTAGTRTLRFGDD